MKVGDLVKMKYISFWMKKTGDDVIRYTEAPLLVLETSNNAVKVILPGGEVKSGLIEYYEVISEAS